MQILKNFSILIIPLVLIELLFSIYFFISGNIYGIIFKLFSKSKINQQIEYQLNWDKNNKLVPGNYVHKFLDKEVPYKINKQGFRGDDFVIEKHKNRILVFGGSSTMGAESLEKNTYPKLLENILNKNNIKSEVYNFGLSGKSLNFIRKTLYSEAIDYNPDLIIINSNRNSIIYDSINVNTSTREANHHFLKLIYFLDENIMTYRFLNKAFKKLRNYKNYDEFLVSPYNDKQKHLKSYFTDKYIDILNELVFFCKKNGIKVMLVKQPININFDVQLKIKNEKRDNLLKKLENYKKENFFELDYEDAFIIITTTILNNNLNYFKNYENVSVVDAIDNEMLKEDNFFDHLHLTPFGNSILANKIAKTYFEQIND